jgi:hypothetical protein
MEQKAAKSAERRKWCGGCRLSGMDRELEIGGEICESVAEAGRVPAQNTALDAAKQRAPDRSSGWRQRTAHLAPWIIQLLWLAAGVATVAYLKSRSWGMFEAIPLMLGAAFGMTAWLQWTIAWALLAKRPIIHRLAYLLAGIMGILVIADWIFEWRRDDKQIPLTMGIISIGFAVPLALVYWRGWRIVALNRDACQQLRTVNRLGQFSISELLLLTTGAAIFLGLTLAQRNLYGQNQWGEIVAEWVIVACGTMLVVVGLAARRFAIAALACSAISMGIIVGAIAWFNRDALSRTTEWLLVGIICAPAVVGLLATIGLVRWWGYRLLKVAPPGGGG